MAMFHSMLEGRFTVRQTEERVQRIRSGGSPTDPNVSAAEDRLRSRLKTKVNIKRDQRGRGEIKIKFSSDEEFEQLLNLLDQE